MALPVHDREPRRQRPSRVRPRARGREPSGHREARHRLPPIPGQGRDVLATPSSDRRPHQVKDLAGVRFHEIEALSVGSERWHEGSRGAVRQLDRRSPVHVEQQHLRARSVGQGRGEQTAVGARRRAQVGGDPLLAKDAAVLRLGVQDDDVVARSSPLVDEGQPATVERLRGELVALVGGETALGPRGQVQSPEIEVARLGRAPVEDRAVTGEDGIEVEGLRVHEHRLRAGSEVAPHDPGVAAVVADEGEVPAVRAHGGPRVELAPPGETPRRTRLEIEAPEPASRGEDHAPPVGVRRRIRRTRVEHGHVEAVHVDVVRVAA